VSKVAERQSGAACVTNFLKKIQRIFFCGEFSPFCERVFFYIAKFGLNILMDSNFVL
jgi:hypothetical protein